jgi:hypothetical protein
MKFLKKIAATGNHKDKEVLLDENPFMLPPDKQMPASLSKEELKKASEVVQTWVRDAESYITEFKIVFKSTAQYDKRGRS